MQVSQPEEQESSLRICEPLQQEIVRFDSENRRKANLKRTPFRDKEFKTPSEESSVFSWIVFYVSLYYNKVGVHVLGFITGWAWYNRIDHRIILGALPTPNQVKTLHKQANVNTIVNLCAEFPGYEKLYSELNIDQIRLETRDFTLPSIDTIHEGISKIMQVIQRNPENTIYIHCKAGRYRSAAIVFCYLLRSYNLNLQEAQKILSDKRPQVEKNLFRMETMRVYSKDVISEIEAGDYDRVPYSH